MELTILDSQGRLVREFGQVEQDPGTHQVLWDGKDSKGKPVSAGVYFCHLRVGGWEDTKKLTLMR